MFDYTLNESELDCLHSASLEWKKEIAMKGKSELKTKKNAIQLVLNIIQKNKDVYAIFSEKWNLPEFYSVVMQPFCVSNHVSELDPIILYYIFMKNNASYRFISDVKVKNIPIFGRISDGKNTIYTAEHLKRNAL